MKKIFLKFALAFLMFIERKSVSYLDSSDMNYDPSELPTFDPTGGILRENSTGNRGIYVSQGGQSTNAQLSIRIKSGTSVKQTVEIFSAINNVAFIKNDSLFTAGSAVGPTTTFSLLKLIGAIANSAKANEPTVATQPTAIFNDDSGNLIYTNGTQGVNSLNVGAWGALYPSAPVSIATNGCFMEISCGQVPYRRLIEDMKDMVIRVNRTRISYTNAQGKYNDLRFKKYKSFAKEDNNEVSPQAYFSPDQFQSLLIDIPEIYYVDKLTGLYMDIEAGDDVSLQFFITAYRNNGLNFEGAYGSN